MEGIAKSASISEFVKQICDYTICKLYTFRSVRVCNHLELFITLYNVPICLYTLA